jgi:hypothetical protein
VDHGGLKQIIAGLNLASVGSWLVQVGVMVFNVF